ncbi:DUF4386 domain-containing protein [Robiginitomaculum antarcticum]|uniref:DUF4386 domain-containing protein n=1 Tax=Robiginitomaculum antarcticum TaxID=437507 RepID=UPI00036B6F1F|nr:DUF4386 domain-containing protein [Robiginitomaculum antarcticum]
MTVLSVPQHHRIARITGLTLLLTIVIGIVSSMTLSQGIDVNMTADIFGTAESMQTAEMRLRGRAYLSLFIFMLELLSAAGLSLLLRRHGSLCAVWSLTLSVGASVLGVLGAMFALNVAGMISDPQFARTAGQEPYMALIGLQVLSDYTSFHLALIGGSAANAGFFYLFWASGLIPRLISGWGIFASGFVVIAIVARDFIPALGSNGITMAFIICNLIAIVSLGVYLLIKGVRVRAS